MQIQKQHAFFILAAAFSLCRLGHAQHSAPIAGPGVPVAAAQNEVPLDVTAESPGLGLHVVDGSGVATGYAGTHLVTVVTQRYRALCVAPCTAQIAPGAYQFAISNGVGLPQSVARLIQVNSAARLRLEYKDRSTLRWLGYAGYIVGLVALIPGILLTLDANQYNYNTDVSSTDGGKLAAGVALISVGAISMLAGAFLSFLQDHRDIQVIDEHGNVRF